MTLTQDQLIELSGYRRNADILSWLKRNGIPHAVKRNGTPALTLAMFENSLMKKQSAPSPNWAALA